MRILFFLYCLFIPVVLFAQGQIGPEGNTHKSILDKIKKDTVAPIDQYRFISIERDTTYLDTSLTIQREYSFNYLRKDNFGLLAFPNEGQTYNTLQYSLTKYSPYPEMGFKAKHFGFLEAYDVKYSSVATPVTELYYKSTMTKGQSVDSFFTLNMTPGLNFSIGYRGLRSEGKYINQLASTGSFRFTTNYHTKNLRYQLKAHFVSHDILNEENGGITTISDFESADVRFTNRQRLEVYLTDAESFLKGKRVFFDHLFRVNPKGGNNNLYVAHQFNYENKFFQYKQPTVSSTVGSEVVNRFGDSYATSSIVDDTRYNKMYNKAGLVYENISLGKFQFFIDDYRSNYYYNQILIRDDKTIPASLVRNINSAGGQYEYQKDKWKGNFLVSRSITNQSLSNINAQLNYDLNDDYQFTFGYQNLNKLPNDNYNLYQSSFVGYNWSENFNNEKINALTGTVMSPWITADVQLSTLKDHLYFKDVATLNNQQIIAPSQYAGTINYISVKLSKEFKFGKFGFDNTVLYQKVGQQDNILNVPELVTRNTIYINDYFFKKALFFQAGITLNYFTKYLANEYNPVIGEFFVQNTKSIGNFPTVDFFINTKIQRTRIYLKAEHFNSAVTGNNFYSSPNNPYRDFTVRFGLIWNFFN
ncbi:putative porin [Flavobacterium sp.]|uniref:putative porin n=1 Tax=Flavobacterium sp. TaxID=239 RepID=UPI00260F1C81|nr:putative porin [Flavobacterium sp.]MDG2431679.1 putative porin [Flavobacterium sp.]